MRYLFAAYRSSGRILDSACGCGYGSLILSQGEKDVTGVDVSQEAINWANKWFPGPKYVAGKIEDSPWDGEFDTIVSIETIEHMREPRKALDAFRRSCRGELIVTVPNEELYPFKAENFVNDESPHFRHYRPMEFEDLLSASGFKVTERFCQVSKFEPEVVAGTNGKFLIYVCG